MKKILLGSTILGAAVLFAGAANAETPKVTVGGFADFQVGVTDEDQDTNLRSQGFRSDTTLTFRIDGKTDAGLGYGGGIDLEADATNDAQSQGTNASRTFVYLDGNWGRVEMGSEVGAQGTMKIDASNIARATGGIDGDFWFFTSSSAQFWATPDLALGYGAGNLGNESQENLNKVTYYTPRFSGFQVGVSYTVDSDDRGQTVTRSDNNAGQAENIFSAGVSYDNTFGDFAVGLAATGEIGDAQTAGTEDLQTWNVGGKVGYQGFTVAASYGDIGDSLRTTASGADDTSYWTAGVAYEYGPFGVSATYLDSEYDNGTGLGDNEFQNLAIGTDYKLAPGLTPYVEVNFIEMDATGTVNDNDATVFIAGTQLSF
jgi:predicted porin